MTNTPDKQPENIELSLFDPVTGSREGTIEVDPVQLVGAGIIMFAILAALNYLLPASHEVVKKLLNLP